MVVNEHNDLNYDVSSADFYPDIDAVRQMRLRLGTSVLTTPVIDCPMLEPLVSGDARVFAKLECLQHTGTFKARGALSVLLSLDEEQLARGVTAVSAGNHAIATAFAAERLGTTAKVVMIGSANPARVEKCRSYGAEVVIVHDVHEAFAVAERIQEEEGRYFVHPFEGLRTFLGTATVGLELCEQLPEIDTVVIPIGGGGLCAGIASAVKQLRPEVRVIGVEPEGADSMRRSFEAGAPQTLDRVATIADSLGAPFALPMSFALCREHVDELVLVSDDELRTAMRLLFTEMHMAVEPACAATTAALRGPLADALHGRSVALIFCGSNIDWQSFQAQAFGS